MAGQAATIVYGDSQRLLEPGDELHFGRGSADLDLGDNPALHRRFGRIFWRDGGWWLHNEGTRLPLSVQDRTSSSSIRLAPGREVSLSFPEAAVKIEAGDDQYEIIVDLPRVTMSDAAAPAVDGIESTIDQSKVPLTQDQRLLLVALAVDKLRNPHAPLELPTNKSVAHRLGWTGTQFNRKLDRLCRKFARNGVSGLVGDSATLATNRRVRLVEHAIESGLISGDDLALLDEHTALDG